jgi:hypothetical protein
MSSLSVALNSSTSGFDINDVAFWDRIAAHFREKLDKMTSSATVHSALRRDVFNSRVSAVKSPKRYAPNPDWSIPSSFPPSLPLWHIMMNA